MSEQKNIARSSQFLVIFGFVAVAIGGILALVGSGNSVAGQPPDSLIGLGHGVCALGTLLFTLGIIAEIFGIGTSLRHIAAASDATLLKDRLPANPLDPAAQDGGIHEYHIAPGTSVHEISTAAKASDRDPLATWSDYGKK